MQTSRTLEAKVSSVASVYMRHVYTWMTTGLVVTAGVALAIASSPAIQQALLGNMFVMIALIVAQFGIVIGLSAAVHKMSAFMATAMFLLYSVLTGLTLSSIFIVYPIGSIANAFFSTAGMFLAMSIYGTVTKRDLTGMGNFLFMGLIGIIIASIVNIFLASSAMDFVISVCGVIIFTGLTAYDTNKLRQFGASAPLDDAVAIRRGAILGALTLYLDFINLFLMMLRLFGGNNSD
ncbi:MAG TPA: Bax inhibitor-1/YccA family protein [Candidatus Desulfovibrio intestinipullorum]|uniref:Bax inhibitor-1/YccA family protein n=1 Tax=Candidatus Desulfovibrio intestinipullorum TaxID=2838536 RepID=A0A9D1TQ76_9BACT|nr:Bax inhibitor-1/YccA family protein [Candidatus Desulfovibrio intestinipullorum]